MVRLLSTAGILLSLLTVSGCRSMWPSIFRPGPTEVQRANASRHDPYTDENIGPEVVGGRPRDFQKPRPEPVRGQPYQNPRWAPLQ